MEEMAQKSVRLNDAKPEEWDAVGESVSGKEAVVSDEGLEKFHEFNVHADTYIKSGIQQGDKITLQWRNDESLGIQVDEVKITSADKDFEEIMVPKSVESNEWDINPPKDLLHWINRVIDKKVYIYISSINDFTRYEEVVGRIADHVEDYENGIWHIGDNPPNKKVTPKHGEWWLIRLEDSGFERVAMFGEDCLGIQGFSTDGFNSVFEDYEAKPICKMIEEKQ